jgi:hypothetical protein
LSNDWGQKPTLRTKGVINRGGISNPHGGPQYKTVPLPGLTKNSSEKSLKAPGNGEEMIGTEFNITVRTNCIFVDLSFYFRNSYFKGCKLF